MEDLSELVSSCRAIDSAVKVTERAKLIEKLHLLLRKNYVMRALDNHSERKTRDPNSNKLFAWDTLFKVVKSQVLREAELLRKNKETQSQTALSNRDRKRRDISELLKKVVRLAGKRGENLKSADVTEHILDILRDDYLFKLFGLGHSQILLKDILSRRGYWRDIADCKWNELLIIYLDILKEGSPIIDRLLSARLIHMIVVGASFCLELRPRKILPAFQEYFLIIKQERSQAGLEYMVKTANMLCKTWAPNSRLQVCRLGEAVVPMLLHVWHQHPSPALKDQLVEFFLLQLAVHHPHGVKTAQDGGFAEDWDIWKGLLQKLYDAMLKSLNEIEDRSRFSTSTREAIVLNPSMIELIADVCNQILTETTNMLEVTQLNIDTQQPGAAPKRRKVETGWEVFKEKLTSLGTSIQLVPWLQVLCKLLEKHPASLPETMVGPLLQTLYQAQADSRRAEVLSCLHQCIRALALCPNTHVLPNLDALWQKLWINSIRCVSAQPGVSTGWQLLETLLRSGLVTNHADVWSLFMPQMAASAQESIALLSTALEMLEVPQKAVTSTVHSTNIGSQTFRSVLLQWLLPESDDEEPVTKRTTDLPRPDLLADVLVRIMLRNTRHVKVPESKQHVSFQDLQDLYLQTTFDRPLQLWQPTDGCAESETSHSSSLKNVQHELFELLQRDAEVLLQHKPSDAGVDQLQRVAYQAAVMAQVLQMMVCKNVILLDQITQLPLWDITVQILDHMTACLANVMNTIGISNLSKTLDMLNEIYRVDGVVGDKHQRAAVFRAINPPGLLTKIMDIITYSPPSLSRTSSLTQANASMSRTHLDLDMDIDTTAAMDDFDMDENSNVQDNDAMDSQESLTSTGTESALSSCHLSEAQHVGLKAAALLCSWCDYETASCSVVAKNSRIPTPRNVRHKLLCLLEQLDGNTEWDPMIPYHLQLMRVICLGVCTPGQILSDDDLDILLQCLQQVCKHFRRDPDVCAVTLQLIGLLLKSLCHPQAEVTAEREEIRRSILHLISVFWRLRSKYTCTMRLALLECLRTVILCDKEGSWCCWEMSEGAGEGQKTVYIAEECLQMLNDAHHAVRLMAVQSLNILFATHGSEGSVSHRKKQEDCFDEVYELLGQVLKVEGEYSAGELSDMSANHTASLLHTLNTIATISPVCEKKAIFAICQMTKENNININLVVKVLQDISRKLSYNDLEQYMVSHLPYLLHHWLDTENNIREFPHQLLGYSSQNLFLVEHVQTVVPFLVMQKDVDAVKWLAGSLGQDWKLLLQTCLPSILIHILPWFALSKSSSQRRAQQSRTAHAVACFDLLTEHISHKDVEMAIGRNLPSIIVNVLMTLHDIPTDSQERGIRAPEPNLPYFPRKVIKMTFDYLTKGHGGDMNSIVTLLCKSQDGIQQVLQSLHCHLLREQRLHESCRILQMYSLFLELLVLEREGGLGGSWPYILREIIYTMAHLLRSITAKDGQWSYFERQIISEALLILKTLCQAACTRQQSSGEVELGYFMPTLVSSVVLCVHDNSQQGEQCVELLEYLVIQCGDVLSKSLKLLDPLPDLPKLISVTSALERLKYADGEFTLLQEIELFVEVGRQYKVSRSSSRLRGLQFLRQQLSSRKNELAMIVKAHQGEVEEDSIVINLVSELMTLAKSSHTQVAMEAAGCLGEIGPVDLATLTVKTPVPRALEHLAYKTNSQSRMYCHIFHQLDQCLLDENVEVVEAASKVLKRVLATKTAYEFAAHHATSVPDDHIFKFLHPFKTSRKKVFNPENVKGEGGKFLETVDINELWQPHHSNHSLWVKNLCTALLSSSAVKDHVLYLLAPICNTKVDFCELVLPYIIHDILVNGSSVHQEVLSRQVQQWLERHCEVHRENASRSATPFSSTTYDNSVCSNPTSVRTIISVIQYLRQQSKPVNGKGKSTPWDNNFWLDINYLHVAEAALSCNLHFSALMYSDIWCSSMRDTSKAGQLMEELQFSQSSHWETLSRVAKEDSARAQELMLHAYRCLGAPDAIYSCTTGKPSNSQARVKMYEHEDQWEKALTSYDLEVMKVPSIANITGLLQALQNSGLHQVMESYLQSLSHMDQDYQSHLAEFRYQTALRNSKWDLPVPSRFDEHTGFQQSLYSSIWAIKEQDKEILLPTIDKARECAIAEMKSSHQECVRSFYPCLSKLLCLSQITDFAKINPRSEPEEIDEIVRKWREQDRLLDNDYVYVEPVLAVRCSLAKLAYELCGKTTHMRTIYMAALEHIARSAREASRLQIGERAIWELQQCDALTTHWSWRIEEARFFWARQEQIVAKDLLKQLICTLEMNQDDNLDAAYLYPRCLGLYGDWLASTHSDSPHEILDNYLIKAVNELELLDCDDDAALDAFLSLARFADAQYQHIDNYMKSPTYEAKQALARQAKEDAEHLKKIGEKSRYRITLEKQSNIDEQELCNMLEDKKRYLKHAILNYLKCLQCGSKHDLRVFRLTSLWFANLSNPDVNKDIKQGLEKISTHKFLPLMYQLAARMSSSVNTSNQEFQTTLDKLIESVVLDHPYHSLNIVLALAHATKDDDPAVIGNTPAKKNPRLSKSSSMQKREEDRVIAAQLLVQKLRNSKRAAIVKDTEKLCLAYIQLAYFNVDKYKTETKPIPLPSSIFLARLTELHNVIVPTVELQVDLSCKYEHITYIRKFEGTFKLAGGINLPKIISCVGSDGVARRQLVKGQDDLRQDAVMQQVFRLVNTLLTKEPETRKRNLRVRTYKVIPLSQRSGLLEWCEGTVPVGEYLVGSRVDHRQGAHFRYRPKDYIAVECWGKLAEAHKQNRKDKMAIFLHVCSRFQPVFRHFFLERYPEPADWYQHQLNYTRSVATNSIVGYILGLGDRHVANILIDCQTAELIHIDLGVAFEQGKIMPTPETVPFRLTRDIVDGMGVAGVEGDFRRCCEETMKVMHQSHEALLTILQVLLYDPLYSWTLSPHKAMLLQQRREAKAESEANETSTVDIMDISLTTNKESGENVNQVAERVLLRLEQKLQGIENGVQLSVSGQVNHLIQEARDPNNLSRLFPGWQAYI